jgi:hypothetical protein
LGSNVAVTPNLRVLQQIVRKLKPELVTVGEMLQTRPTMALATSRVPGYTRREFDILESHHVAPPPLREQERILGTRVNYKRIAGLQPARKQALVGGRDRKQMVPSLPAASGRAV